jgi:hypothetical protein
MGRSVHYPNKTIACVFTTVTTEEPEDAEWNWQDFMANLKSALKARIPGLDDHDSWIDREGHVILSHDNFLIGVSEYCGMVSVWAVRPTLYDEDEPVELGDAFTEALLKGHITEAVAEAGGEVYRKVGSFSNGEGVYERAKR